MASRQEQKKATSDERPHFEKRDLRPKREPTPQEILIIKLDEKVDEVEKNITDLVNKKINDLVENTKKTPGSITLFEELSCRKTDAQSGLESKSVFDERLKKDKSLLINTLRDNATTHFETLYKDPTTGLETYLDKQTQALQATDPNLDPDFIKKRFLTKIIGVIDPMTNTSLNDGMIDKILKKLVDKALIDASQGHFEFLENRNVANKDVATDKWVASVKNLPDAELQLLTESAINLRKKPDAHEAGSPQAIQSEMVRKTLVTGLVGIGAAVAGVALSTQIGAGSLLFTGLAFTVLAYNGVKQHFLHRDFGARMTTIWDKTLRQLEDPRDMDSAVAWSGIFFKVLRDYNPIPAILAPDKTDFWRNSPDSKKDAILNNLRSAAAYGAKIIHEEHSKDSNRALVEVARDERFGTFIKKVRAEISAYRERWNYIPDILNNISVGTSVTSGLLFAIDLITKFK